MLFHIEKGGGGGGGDVNGPFSEWFSYLMQYMQTSVGRFCAVCTDRQQQMSVIVLVTVMVIFMYITIWLLLQQFFVFYFSNQWYFCLIRVAKIHLQNSVIMFRG